MSDKILIFMEKYYLKPIGGPAGYLYNLNNELEKQNIKNIHFIERKDDYVVTKKMIKKMPLFLSSWIRICKRSIDYKRLLNSDKKTSDIKLEDYDIIHFHSTKEMFRVKDSLEGYNGLVILTSHSPKPLSLEIYEDVLRPFERKFLKKMYAKLIEIDKYAFNRANYIVFPCQDAEEPYHNNWDEYKEIKERNKDKYRYFLTGINPCSAKMNNKEVREKYNIPKDAFVISYVGRHNETKGYDALKKIGEKMLHQNDNIYFFIAGKEEPLKGLNNDHWIEVGWTNDPHSIIAASDVFVLPNKETYFDIIMLEVLSLGKIVVASNTGGNKYFKNINAEGIFLYSSVDEAIDLINQINTMRNDEKMILEKSNKVLFDKKFTSEIFCNNYVKLLNELKK